MEQMSLFDDREQSAPLATRLRPDSLEDFAGQERDRSICWEKERSLDSLLKKTRFLP